ncbi:MAG: M23 family metallopeptidase [Candidatus Dormibacteria bacterium]
MVSPLILKGGPYVVTQGFGCTTYSEEIPDPSCPTGYFHSGIDIGCPCGTLALAGGVGVVSRIGSTAVKGICQGKCKQGCLGPNAVGITSDLGLTFWYGHLQSHAVRAGQKVVRGQPLGLTGTMGCSTGCHLHFEVDPGIDARPLTLDSLDPSLYLDGWG